MRSSTILVFVVAVASAVFGCVDVPDDADEPEVASAMSALKQDVGIVTRWDGGVRCRPLPCPSGAPWDQLACTCKPVSNPDGGLCFPELCPTGQFWDQTRCSCQLPPQDGGECLPQRCPPMATWDEDACACTGPVVSDPDDTDERNTEDTCGHRTSWRVSRERRSL